MAGSELETEADVADVSPTGNEALKLSVKIENRASCERHVVVTVPREEIDRYFRKAFDNLRPRADVPGFRIGKAPRKLVEKKFQEQVADQVKGSLLMESLQQVTESGKFSAISEPNFNMDAITLPETGDFTYEFTIEVRPEFETPNWKGLTLERPSHTFSDVEIEQHLLRTIARFSHGVATGEPIRSGDFALVDIKTLEDGKVVQEIPETRVQVLSSLSFPDGEIADFDKVLEGAIEGDVRTATLKISENSENEAYRGKEVTVEFTVIEVTRLAVDEMGSTLLADLGFETSSELRGFVRAELEKQLEYRQHQTLRQQITEKLTASAQFDLPPDLVSRQTQRELQRQSLELRRSGFGDDQIREIQNASRRNAQAMTIQALREHFILEKIAEEEKIEPSSEEYDREIELIAQQSDVSSRRIRARLERSGQMDAIRNQIIERRVIELIVAASEVSDKADDKLVQPAPKAFAVSTTVAPEASAIPEAKFDNETEVKSNGIAPTKST